VSWLFSLFFVDAWEVVVEKWWRIKMGGGMGNISAMGE